MKKKVISVLATMAMCFSVLATSVQASENTNVEPAPRFNTCSTEANSPHGSSLRHSPTYKYCIATCYFCGSQVSVHPIH